MKTCIKCSAVKDESGFTPRNGLLPNICRCCQSKSRMDRKHSGGQRSLVEQAAYMREYRVKNRDVLLAKAIEKRKQDPLKKLWKQVSARKEFLNITHGEFMKLEVPETCPALGIPISHDLGRDNIPSVDRINPNLPYETGNIAIISFRANMIKSVGSSKEHELIAKWSSSFGEFSGKPLLWGRTIPVGQQYLKYGRKRERVGDSVNPVCI